MEAIQDFITCGRLNRDMKIRTKTLLLLGLIMISLIVTSYAAAYGMTLSNVKSTEKEDSTSNVNRFINNLNIDTNSVVNTVSDWGSWDDTYRFVEDNNSAYIESNLVDQTFVNLHVNMIAYFNENNDLVWGEMFNNQTSNRIGQKTLNQISSYNALFIRDPNTITSGLIILGEMPFLVAAHPILTSLHEGPAHGTIIMGRSLDQLELDTLSNTVGLPISMAVIGGLAMPQDFQHAGEILSAQNPTFLQDLNDTSMAGYARASTTHPLL